MTVYKNKHGRRPGRGVRPWLLIPKVLSVGALFGGFMGASVLLHASDPQNPEQWARLIETVGTLFRRLIVPAVLCVILFGALLLLQHMRVFLTLRWVRVKLVLLLVTLPPLHLTGRWLIDHARRALEAGQLDRVEELMRRFTLTVDLAVLAVIVVVVIGRHKPRLGQRPKPPAAQRNAPAADGQARSENDL
jgi:uncharacterized membrane protein